MKSTSLREQPEMKKYVVGFAFNGDNVLLINKKRPSWQKGLYNGIGGHIESEEQPIDAMVREFKEESGIATVKSDWEFFAIMKDEDWICHCFRSLNMFDLSQAKQTTDEEPKIINIYTLQNYATISNIPALIGLARDVYPPKETTLCYAVPIVAQETEDLNEAMELLITDYEELVNKFYPKKDRQLYLPCLQRARKSLQKSIQRRKQ